MRWINRKTLLAGTALASTLLVASVLSPSPAQAQTITIETQEQRNNSNKINDPTVGIEVEIENDSLSETNVDFDADLNFVMATAGDLDQSAGLDQSISIVSGILVNNSGEIDPLIGILTSVDNTNIDLANFGFVVVANAVAATGGNVTQVLGLNQANAVTSNVGLGNSGGIIAQGIGLFAPINNTTIDLTNFGIAIVANAVAATGGNVTQTATLNQSNAITTTVGFANSGNIGNPAVGILIDIDNQDFVLVNTGVVFLVNTIAATGGNVTQTAALNQTNAVTTNVGLNNSGRIDAGDTGILVDIDNDDITLGSIALDGNLNLIAATAGNLTQSIEIAQSNRVVNQIGIVNSGDIQAGNVGIGAVIDNDNITFGTIALNADLNIISATAGDVTQSSQVSQTNSLVNHIGIANSGNIQAGNIGIAAAIDNDDISFTNVAGTGVVSTGVVGGALSQTAAINQTNSIENSIAITNSGSVWGGNTGIFASIDPPVYAAVDAAITTINAGGTETVSQNFFITGSINIFNTGSITAGSLLAIDTDGAATTIVNTSGGVITGFIDLTDENDRFHNEANGTFEARLTSNFRGGTDLLTNAAGATIHATGTTSFINLNRFETQGLITMVDGREGDVFEISNTPGALDLVFVASGNSTLAVDTFLGGPGSISDEFIINGDVSGQTRLVVNNTNFGGGAAGAVIPVVFANGTVSPNAFFLPQPIDTGFFEYDLFFRPTGSGIFELRSFLGGGALLLPQLITAAQDTWHQTSSTWFDRTADLRVLLHGGTAPLAYNPTAKNADAGPHVGPVAPAVWARGSGAWLDRDNSESVTAFGNTYRYNLDRELDIIDFQLGLDLGKRDFLSDGDILVFGMLGGFVHADLDYKRLVRNFDFEGGQVGGYATYLNGGLFVDTLLNVHLMELETRTLGFPNSLDATTVGLRTDSGYRFGSFGRGAFIEPLATIAVLWADIDSFTNSGNQVSFDDDANVRGRLGLRVGTSYPVWGTTTVEPFVIGSLWGHLSGDNKATLVSSGTTFRFEDDLDDVWGEVSLGVNFFNPSAATAVFAKVDVTFGDDVDGIGGKAGMRVAW
ncbi:MAG: autotransporter domain-containing protein [Methyloceanibacter sp.]